MKETWLEMRPYKNSEWSVPEIAVAIGPDGKTRRVRLNLHPVCINCYEGRCSLSGKTQRVRVYRDNRGVHRIIPLAR